MTEKNYTIPINEEFDKFDGCPICRLHAKLEQQSLEYIMGAAMMEPDVRIQTNETGFCSRHYQDMLSAKNRLSLALMLETHLKEIERLTSVTPKTGKKDLKAAITQLTHISENCFLCNRIQYTLGKYCENIVYLWKTEPLFREKLQKQPELCFHHTAALLKSGNENLSTKLLTQFATDLFNATGRGLSASSDKIGRFCKSFDYRYAGGDLGDAKYAAEHAIGYLTGTFSPKGEDAGQ